MTQFGLISPPRRLFVERGRVCLDESGFLDFGRTPKAVSVEALLQLPAVWITAPPWRGKTTVARGLHEWLDTDPCPYPGLDSRIALTELGQPGIERDFMPNWWNEWTHAIDAPPAVWIIDGLDEGADQNERLARRILSLVEELSPAHVGELRLVILTRDRPELAVHRDHLGKILSRNTGRSLREFELAPVDRAIAVELVGGAAELEHVCHVIRENGLSSVAGNPIVLSLLKGLPRESSLTTADIWLGVLCELLGRSERNRGRQFDSHPDERFEAAYRIAAILSLTRCDAIRDNSLDPKEPTIGSIFPHDANPLRLAAGEACQTAAFHALAEEGGYRFANRNIQDWLTAFALAQLPSFALPTVLCTASGCLHPRLRETARLIREITKDPKTQCAINRIVGDQAQAPNDADPTLAQACTYLDQLEDMARTSDRGLRLKWEAEQGLAKLNVAGMSAEVARRLADPTRPAQVKRLLLDVAGVLEAMEAVDPAVDIVLDDHGDDELRIDAVLFVCRLGGPVHLRRLEVRVGEAGGSTDGFEHVRGILIFELLTRGLWPAWRAAIHSPASAPHVMDRRALVLRELESRLTAEDARQVLPHFAALLKRHTDGKGNRLPPFLSRVISIVAEQGQIPPADVDILEKAMVKLLDDESLWWHALTVSHMLNHIPRIRRRVFAYDAGRILQGVNSTTTSLWILASDDWEWLRQRAQAEWAALPDIWSQVFRLAEQACQERHISDDEWSELNSEIESRCPGLKSRIEAGRQQCKEEQAQREAELRQHVASAPKSEPLASAIQRILSDPLLSATERLAELGFLCFHPYNRPHRITGTWEDLSDDLRSRVLDAWRAGLTSGAPSPLAEGNAITGMTLGEAAAFDRVVRSEGDTTWLTTSLIERWLPTALHGLSSGDWPDLIRACWNVSRAATDRALVETVVNQTRRYDNPSNLSMIPVECWSDAIADQVAKLLDDETISSRSRGQLLEFLASREIDRALPTAKAWARRELCDSPDDHLRQAGRNVQLCREPLDVLTLIEQEFDGRKEAALKELHVLFEPRAELRADWRTWTLTCQEKLASLLIRLYPFGPDNDDGDDDDDAWGIDLRSLRDVMMEAWLRIQTPEYATALDRLATQDAVFAQIVQQHRASSVAEQVICEIEARTFNDPAALPLNLARRVLDRTGFRLVRHADDLLDAVLVAIDQIQDEIGHDLPLLYGPPKRDKTRSTAKLKRPAVPERQHLEEDALQAYLRRRLNDIMPGIVHGVQVTVMREEQVGYRRRLDLRVTAPCLPSREIATVVIEVKWSTNPDVKAALVDQLGEKYLIKERLTHGVLFVGWAGRWQPGGRRPERRDMSELAQFLRTQRDEFCETGQPGEGLRIEPVVLDLCWRQSDA